MKFISLLMLLAGCNDGGLSTATPEVPDLGGAPSCIGECELQSCSSLHDAFSCDARPDCWSLWSGDLPCDSTACNNHFVSCNDGPPVCAPTGVCNAACTTLTPTCRAGFSEVFGNSCCAIGCSSRCH